MTGDRRATGGRWSREFLFRESSDRARVQRQAGNPPEPRQKYPGELAIRVFRDPIGAYTRISRECGDFSHFKLGGRDIYLITNPEYIKEVVINHHQNVVKSGSLKIAKPLLGEGLLTSEGEYHHRQRRLVQPAFHQSRIEGYAKVMAEYAQKTSEGWKEGQVLDVHDEMMRLALAVVSVSLFNANLEDESAEVSRALTGALESLHRSKMPLVGALNRLPIGRNQDLQKARTTLDAIIYRIIEERRKSGRDEGDLLSMLLSSRDTEGDGTGMSDLQVRDEAVTLLLAGHETTAKALTWAWYLISEHPEVEARLHAEVDQVIGKGMPTAQDAKKLVYTDQIVTETLRLYPPAWTLGSMVIKPFELGGCKLPVGSTLIMSQYLVQHDSRYYPDPEKFTPERWTPEFSESLPRFAYFPFGGGPRACIGERFAWMETVLIIATIARNWRLQHVPGHKVELLPRLTLRPRYGMKMRASRRQ